MVRSEKQNCCSYYIRGLRSYQVTVCYIKKAPAACTAGDGTSVSWYHPGFRLRRTLLLYVTCTTRPGLLNTFNTFAVQPGSSGGKFRTLPNLQGFAACDPRSLRGNNDPTCAFKAFLIISDTASCQTCKKQHQIAFYETPRHLSRALARTKLALFPPQALPSRVAASPGQHKACLDLATVTAFPGCCLLRPKNMLVFTPGMSKADPSLVFLRKIRQLQLTSISSALQSRSFTAVTTAGSAT